MKSPLRVLVIAQGSPGGIGRAELLLRDALEKLQSDQRVRFRMLLKSNFPPYLVGDSPQSPAGRTRLVANAFTSAIRMRPDIILFTHINLGVLVPPLRIVCPFAHFVTIIYGDEVWGTVPAFRGYALRHVDRIWSISHYTSTRFLAANAVAPSRLRLIRLGLTDAQRVALAPNGDTPTTKSGLDVLCVTRLGDRSGLKGVDQLISALPAVVKECAGVRLRIVGDGVGRSQLERLARERGVSDHVEFLGWLPDSALHNQYRLADAFVLPSAQEGFGLVYLEAMAAGLPIVAVRSGATPELVTDQDNGLLVDYGDVTALSQALVRLLAEPGTRADMGQAALRRVEKDFTFAEVTRVLGDLLTDAQTA